MASFPFRLQCLPLPAQRPELCCGWPSVLTGAGRMVAVEWAGQGELGEESSSAHGFQRERGAREASQESTDCSDSSAHTPEDCSSQASLGKDF